MGTSLYDLFSTDAQAETGGAWMDFGDAGRVRVAHAGGSNKKYNRLMIAKTQPYRRVLAAMQSKPTDQSLELVRSIQMEVFAEAVVLGWEGVLGRDKQPLDYSKEACLTLFKELPNFFDDVVTFANSIANYHGETLDADVKN